MFKFKRPNIRRDVGLALLFAILVPYLVEPTFKWFVSSLMWLGTNVSESFTKDLSNT